MFNIVTTLQSFNMVESLENLWRSTGFMKIGRAHV